jgi:hypothetical protein
MVQIIPAGKPSFGSRIGAGLGGGFSQAIADALKGRQEEQSQMRLLSGKSDLEKEKNADIVNKLTSFFETEEGKKFDPIERQVIMGEATGLIPKGTGKTILESRKSREENDFLSQLFGGKKSNELPETDDGISGQIKSIDEMPKQFDPTEISDEAIARASVINPNLARSIQHSKDVALRERTAANKEVSSSYKENQSFIDKTYDQYEDTLRRGAIIDRMDQLNDSDELSDSGVINALETLGLAPEWLKNPKNEEYTKLGLDLLGGGTLQADYGSRVLQSEFKVAQQRIPTLNQTKEGRKQISENIKTMLLPAKLKHERLQFYLDQAKRTGKPLPHDLRGTILKDIKPQLEEAYDKFKQRNGRYKVKDGTIPDDNALEKYYYISDGNEEKAMKFMKEDGYDIGS